MRILQSFTIFAKLHSALANLERFKLKKALYVWILQKKLLWFCPRESFYLQNYVQLYLPKMCAIKCKSFRNFNTYQKPLKSRLPRDVPKKKRLNERKNSIWFSKMSSLNFFWFFFSSIRSALKEVQSLGKNITDFELFSNISVAPWTASATPAIFYIYTLSPLSSYIWQVIKFRKWAKL